MNRLNNLSKLVLNNNNNTLINNLKNYSTKKSKKPILLGYEKETEIEKESTKKLRVRKRKSDKKKEEKEEKEEKEVKIKKEIEEKKIKLKKDISINNNKEKSDVNINNGNNKEIWKTKKSKSKNGGILSKYQASNFIRNNWMKRHLTDYWVKEAKDQSLVSRAAFKLININKQIKILKPGQVVVDLGASPGSWTQVAKTEVTESGLVISVDINDKFQLLNRSAFIKGDFTLQPIQEKIIELASFKKVSNLHLHLELKRQKQLEDNLNLYKLNNNKNNNNIEEINKENNNINNFNNNNINNNNNNNNNIYNNNIEEEQEVFNEIQPEEEIENQEEEIEYQPEFEEKEKDNKRLIDVILSDMAPHYCGISSVDHSRLIELQTSALNFAIKHLKRGGSFVCKVSRGGEERDFFSLLEKDFTSVKTMKPDASRLESTEIYYIAKGFIPPPSSL